MRVGVKAFASILLFGAAASAAETPAAPDIAEQRTRIAALSFLAGDWEGSGWIMTGPGQRFEFKQTEEIRPMLGGGILTIHGTGRAPDAAKGAPPSFEAFAIISWDDVADRYRFRSYARGYVGDYDAALEGDNVLVWRAPSIEYRITVDGDRWFETGHRTLADGKKVQFFEMTVTRQAAD